MASNLSSQLLQLRRKALRKTQKQKTSMADLDELEVRPRDKATIVPPVGVHKQTFILLHGRGDHADHFGGGLLDTRLPTYGQFHEAFPNAKFIFPQAPARDCARQPNWKLLQWFDNWGYDTLDAAKEEVKLEGLTETTPMVHALIQAEIDLVGPSNIIIGGLSQGCAASMIALLSWNGPPLAGYLGMCGHLPYRLQIEASADGTASGSTGQVDAIAAVKWLRSKLSLPETEITRAVFQDIPVFTGHGDQDRVVPTQYGRDTAKCLQSLGARSIYKEYAGLVHWYNEAMLEDFIQYFKENTSWELT